MQTRSLVSFLAMAAIAVVLLVVTLVVGNKPLLGLDLQGGAEVVLRPSQDDANLRLAENPENLERAAEIIRKRVDAIGVAEPDVTVQGTDLVVQLPGLDNQQRAIELVGQTAELRFRPVLVSPNPDNIGRQVDGVNGGPGTDELRAGVVTSKAEDFESQSIIALNGPDLGAPLPYLLGPTLFTGAALEGADAFTSGNPLDPGWQIEITFQPGAAGVGLLNQAANACFNRTSVCPEGQIAVVLDSTVNSTNGFNDPNFDSASVVLSRQGGFLREEAEDQALVLDFGALPLAFDDPAEAGLIRSVSATLGRDSLNAGLIAGLIGLIIVTLYMLWYYRLLGLAAMLSLAISATLLWVIVAFLSETRGLALTLAGIVGLIVSVGVSLDSNVVYFEHVKEDVSSGRPLPIAADKSFEVAFRTVFYANLATLIGAAILYFLTIGSVRGFALMLGIASVLDLLATYLFMRPFVRWLTESKLGNRPKLFGIRRSTEPAIEGAGA